MDEPNLKEILKDIAEKPTVPVWPHAGKALGLSRSHAYAAARNAEFDVIRIGGSVRAVSAGLRRILQLETMAA